MNLGKKTLGGLLALSLALSLPACSSGGPAAAPTPSPSPSAAAGSDHYPVTITNYDYAGNPVEYT